MNLIRYDAARKALAEAHAVDEVKDIRDKAAAMSAYARQAKDPDLISWATEIKIRAERKCGELLRDGAKNGDRAIKGNPPEGNQHQRSDVASCDIAPTLSDIGISRDQSSRWQKLADMPEEHFETAVATAKEHAGQVTTAHMLRVAEKLRELGDLKTDIAAAERHNAEHPDPDECALRVWVPIESCLNDTQRAISRGYQSGAIPPCPNHIAEQLLRQWAAISEFLSMYARQS
jgi:hypothetical protein